jgi:hypothetical protein
MIDSHQLFIIWISFSILVLSATLPFVIWAIRSGQFSKFDYASRLPLRSQIVEKQPTADNIDEEKNVSA